MGPLVISTIFIKFIEIYICVINSDIVGYYVVTYGSHDCMEDFAVRI